MQKGCDNFYMTEVVKFHKVSFEQFQMDVNTIARSLGMDAVDDTDIRERYESLQLPKRSTAGSAGYDFFFPYKRLEVTPGYRIVVPTGIRAEIDEGWVLMLCPRSSLGFKYGMRFSNTLGIIDSDYIFADNEGHIMADIRTDDPFTLTQHDRYMQGILLPYGVAYGDNVQTKRTGGIGSTGK